MEKASHNASYKRAQKGVSKAREGAEAQHTVVDRGATQIEHVEQLHRDITASDRNSQRTHNIETRSR
jgi:hypothetical protein